MLDCWPTTGCEIISQKNYERLFRGWRRLFIAELKKRMHRNRQNGQLYALQREAGRSQCRSIEITVTVRHPSAIHLSVIEQKTVFGTVYCTEEVNKLIQVKGSTINPAPPPSLTSILDRVRHGSHVAILAYDSCPNIKWGMTVNTPKPS